MDLFITEIFHSIQGESTSAGFPAVFVRLSECNLRCSYCDTEYAYEKGEKISIDNLVNAIKQFENVHHVAITGGEPLLQENINLLVEKLLALRYIVQIETNGSQPIENIPVGAIRIVDVKTPSSNEEKSFHLKNINHLNKNDEVKFVIANNNDFEFAQKFIRTNLKECSSVINFSPVHKSMPANMLAELILKNKLNVRLNLQLHKIIWPEGEPRK